VPTRGAFRSRPSRTNPARSAVLIDPMFHCAMRVNARDTYTEPAEVELPVRAGEVDWEGHTALFPSTL
jgi:hypothetical protein